MKALILGLNYAPEEIGIAVYTTGMAEALAYHGHEVTIVTGQPYYPDWQVRSGYSQFSYARALENAVTIVRCPHYVPARPTGLKRIIHHLSFAASSFWPALLRALLWQPDVVIAIAPSLFSAPTAFLSAKLAGARAWLHVQDFEVDAAFATGLLNGSDRRMRWAHRFEQVVLQCFEKVSAPSPGMCVRLAKKGVAAERIVELPNWADLRAIASVDLPSLYRDERNINTRHVALYSGNIANKQGLEVIINAAQRLKQRKDLTFVVCGEGSAKPGLMDLAKGLSNVQFRGLQPISRLADLLSLASFHLLPQRAGTNGMFLPSKLGNMLASGRPVIACVEQGTDLAAAIAGCGLVTPPEDAIALASAIEATIDDPSSRKHWGHAARHRAEESWNREAILGRFVRQVEALAQRNTARAAIGTGQR